MQRPSFSRLTAYAFLLGAAACGGVVVENPGGSSMSGAGGTTTTATGTGGITSTTTATGTGGITTIPTALCGGQIGSVCSPDSYCAYDPSAPCGGFDVFGVCQPKPSGCDDDCPGVCGCDGKFYCNSCGAHQAGVDVDPLASCVEDLDTYRAVNMFTGLPRFAIVKASPSRSLCFRLVAEPVSSTATGIVGDGWGIASAEVTNDVYDCYFDPGWPPLPLGESFSSMKGIGTLSVPPPGSMICGVGIHAKVDFSGAPAWAPQAEAFDADGLPVEGGCAF